MTEPDGVSRPNELAHVVFSRSPLELDIRIPSSLNVALVGPNGAGKTTVLRCLAGLEADAVVSWAGDKPPTLGYLPQRVSLYPAMTLVSNVASSLRFTGSSKETALAAARIALELVDVAHLADRRPHEVSGGQRQRAGLARAIVAQPSLVLLDEPFSAIDIETRAEVRRRIIGHLAATGTRCVMATHDDVDVVASEAVQVTIPES